MPIQIRLKPYIYSSRILFEYLFLIVEQLPRHIGQRAQNGDMQIIIDSPRNVRSTIKDNQLKKK